MTVNKFFLLFCLTFLVSITYAQSEKWILVVGIDNYGDYSRRYCSKDAQILAEQFAREKPDSAHITALTNEDATREKIQQAWKEIAKKIKPQDTFIFFYAGHGFGKSETITHLATFSPSGDDFSKTLSTTLLNKEINSLNCGNIICLFDIYYYLTTEPAQAASEIAKISHRKKPTALLVSALNTPIFAQRYWPQGMFADYLIQGISGQAQQFPHDRVITTKELFEYATIALTKVSQKANQPKSYFKNGAQQKPLVVSHLIPLENHRYQRSVGSFINKRLAKNDQVKPSQDILPKKQKPVTDDSEEKVTVNDNKIVTNDQVTTKNIEPEEKSHVGSMLLEDLVEAESTDNTKTDDVSPEAKNDNTGDKHTITIESPKIVVKKLTDTPSTKTDHIIKKDLTKATKQPKNNKESKTVQGLGTPKTMVEVKDNGWQDEPDIAQKDNPKTRDKSTQAKSQKRKSKYYALMIANYRYSDPRSTWYPLHTPQNNAKALKKVLETRYGFKGNIYYLKNASSQSISVAFDEFEKFLQPQDNVLICYFGHSYLDRRNKRGFWIDPKINRRKRRDAFIDNELIYRKVHKISKKVHNVLLIAEATFDKRWTERKKPSHPRSESSNKSCQVLAFKNYEYIEEYNTRYSPLTQFLLKALTSNTKKSFSTAELTTYIRKAHRRENLPRPYLAWIKSTENSPESDFWFIRSD